MISSQKQRIKERIKASNENVANGLPPDQWVVAYREKNNITKAKWKAKQPKKEPIKRIANSGSFKKGSVPANKKTEEERLASKKRWAENTKKWHSENKERINLLARQRKKNPEIRIKANLRKRLSTLLRLSIAKKHKQTMDLLGCDMLFFMNYLSSKFKDGMSFDNYGDWHLDHIIPCDFFDLTNPNDQLKCFHYTNIQPLWADENRRKSNKLTL